MSALWIALAVCAVVLAGAAIGAWLRGVLPKDHFSDESHDSIKIGIGLIATISALVLGLLVASAKESFDTKADEVKQSAARTILLDRNLMYYGDDAQPIRDILKAMTLARMANYQVLESDVLGRLHPDIDDGVSRGIEQIQHRLRTLVPANAEQTALLSRAIELATELAQTRWLLLEQAGGNIPVPFLFVLVMWLAVFFACMSLFAPRNATVYVVIVCCALSVSSAIFLILELDQPFTGLLHISSAPFEAVLQQLGSQR